VSRTGDWIQGLSHYGQALKSFDPCPQSMKEYFLIIYLSLLDFAKMSFCLPKYFSCWILILRSILRNVLSILSLIYLHLTLVFHMERSDKSKFWHITIIQGKLRLVWGGNRKLFQPLPFPITSYAMFLLIFCCCPKVSFFQADLHSEFWKRSKQ
jgi:hypothetical protein